MGNLPVHNLPQGRIRISELITDKIFALPNLLVPLQHALKVAEVLRNAVLSKVFRLLESLLLLICTSSASAAKCISMPNIIHCSRSPVIVPS